jgi:DNA helicase HerA-like ATPase
MNLKETRLREHVGIVTSDTSTVQFGFFVTPLKNRTWMGKEDFVMVDHPVFGEQCPLLAVVKEIRNYEEVVGTTVNEKTVETMATGEILGYVDLRDAEVRPLRKLSVPPSPGSKVYLPFYEFLEDIFLRDTNGKRFDHALHVGTLESRAAYGNGDSRQLNFYFNGEDFARQHFLITGMSGAGKTHTAMVMVEELANKTGRPVVVLDPYGEYVTVGVAGKRLKELASKDYPFDFKVSVFACDPEGTTKVLRKHGVELARDGRFSVRSVPVRWSKACDEKAEAEIKETLREGVNPGQVTVIDAKGLPADERGNLFTCCVRALWQTRADGSVGPFVLVVEDAEGVEAKTLRRIASEGRKVGVSLCLLSQNPTEMSGTVLSQMGTQMMGRTTDAEDLEHLRNMAGEKCALLPQLTTGEWIVNGINLVKPTKVFVRDRYSLTV